MAEKFSKFRDPGTGIQVFLTPVAASTSSSSSSPSSLGPVGLVLTPIFVILGILRSLIGGLFWALYLASGSAGLLSVVLWTLGFVSLPVETVAPGGMGRSRGGSKNAAAQNLVAKKGDIVVANHSSWLDLLIVAYLHPGIQFLVPVIPDSAREEPSQPAKESGSAARRTPKKNAISANTRIVTPSSPSTVPSTSAEIPILGYTILSLTSAIRFVGGLPASVSQISTALHGDLDTAIKSSCTPLAIFPEVVTSNNRALLTSSLPHSAPCSMKACVVVTIKYSPPTATCTTSVYSVPISKLKHLLHILFLSSPVRSVGVRQTSLSKEAAEANWAEETAGLMSSLARLKRTGLGWTSKKEFLSMVNARNKRS